TRCLSDWSSDVCSSDLLEECNVFPGKKIEVLNFGVSGYGTAQELLTLREQVWKYSPDIVMLAITTNNDITDNLRALKKTDEIPRSEERRVGKEWRSEWV